MFGPLPQLYRMLLVTIAVVVGIASGAWVAHFAVPPVAATAGVAMGAVAGLLFSYALVHDFSHHQRPARVVRRS